MYWDSYADLVQIKERPPNKETPSSILISWPKYWIGKSHEIVQRNLMYNDLASF